MTHADRDGSVRELNAYLAADKDDYERTWKGDGYARAEAAEAKVAELEAEVERLRARFVHQIVYVQPGASAFLQAVCACGQKLSGSGTVSFADLLATHIRAALAGDA